MKKGMRSQCPISLTLDVIGDKWTLLILRDLIIRGKRRYQDFLNSKEKISTNILAERLVKLEKLQIISKSDDPTNRKQYLYTPTQKGIDLLPILFDFMRWGIKNEPNADLTIPFVKKLQADENGLMEEILSQFEKSRISL
jgi:DNA-binding HxlR family transcriptional regulator